MQEVSGSDKLKGQFIESSLIQTFLGLTELVRTMHANMEWLIQAKRTALQAFSADCCNKSSELNIEFSCLSYVPISRYIFQRTKRIVFGPKKNGAGRIHVSTIPSTSI